MKAIAAVVAVLALALPALADAPRHTPNFPVNSTSVDLTSLAEVLKLVNTSTLSVETVSQLVEEGAISREEGARLLKALNTSLDELEGRVDPSILSNIERLLNSSEVNPEELRDIVQTLVSLQESGLLDPHDFIALANILANAFKRLNLDVPIELSYGILRSLSKVIETPTPTRGEESVSTELSIWRFPNMRVGLPSIQQVSLQEGSTWIAVLLLLSLTTVLVLIYWRSLYNYASKLSAKVGDLVRREVVSEGNDVLSIYWASVRLVEKVSKVKKLDYLTHREYLNSVARSSQLSGTSKLIECFGEITKLYEVSRFSHEFDPSAVARARQKFSELVRALG
ncbi:MAG: hypothetical protein QW509_04685 [Sulfolobales archaeon]